MADFTYHVIDAATGAALQGALIAVGIVILVLVLVLSGAV
jgi:hypothetical protein